MIITRGLGGVTRGYGGWAYKVRREVLRLKSYINRKINLKSILNGS